MRLLLFAAAGGAIGAGARYLVNIGFGRALGAGFPWSTLFVNVLGSLLMGVLIEILALRLNVSPEVRTLLVTGVLGGFTTFSAFSLDFAVLIERGETLSAMAYALGSFAASIGALFIGLSLVRAILT
ncbi:MAG: fluoride efflux transporter CrcB [Hyphomicrobiaceae bacterium]|nr:fluoride efflux transporter CrcB [Hyphomicrobiaceae bacterium]